MYVYIQCSHTKYIWSVLHKNASNILTLIRPLFGGYPEHQKLSRNAPFNILQQNGCLFKLGIPSKWHFSYGTTANLRPLNFRDQSSKNTLLVTYIYIYTIIYAVYQHIPLYPHDIFRVCPSLDGISHSYRSKTQNRFPACRPIFHAEKRIFPWFSYDSPLIFPCLLWSSPWFPRDFAVAPAVVLRKSPLCLKSVGMYSMAATFCFTACSTMWYPTDISWFQTPSTMVYRWYIYSYRVIGDL